MKIKEDNKKNYLSQQGITLIALVITIIVLLILAAVTISTVFGENGLLKSIEIAREKTKIAEYKEDLNQKLLEAKMNVLLDNSKVLEETRKIILRDKKYDGAVVSEVKDNKFTVITKEGYKFEVTPDGVEYLEKTSGTIEENKGSIVMTAAVEGAKANITFELKTEKTMMQWIKEWVEKYTADKTETDLEAEVVKAYNKNNKTTYENFDDLLAAKGMTREELRKEAEKEGVSYKLLLFEGSSSSELKVFEIYFAYILELSGTETDYNKQLEIINDTDKLKETIANILGYDSFKQLLEDKGTSEEKFEEDISKFMQESNATYNQVLCTLACEQYEPITVNVSNGDSFKVSFGNIINSEPYEYTSSEVGTLTFVATGPQGMTGSIDIEFTAAKVKLTVKHINKSGAELKTTTETEYDKDTAVTVKSETISGYKTYSAKITATEVNETLTEGAPVELSFGIYMDTEVVITYDVLQSGETEKEYEEKPTISEVTNTNGEKTAIKVSSVAKNSSIKDSLPTDIKNSDNSYMVDIEPVKSNSGPLTITLDVSNKAEDGDTANVRHYKNSVWDNLGDFIVAQGKITFTIDSFSPFCITIKKKGSSTGGDSSSTEIVAENYTWTQEKTIVIGTPKAGGTKVTKEVGDDYNYDCKVSDYKGSWKVLGAENGKLLIMSTINVGTLGVSGKEGYNTGVSKLNAMCAKYGTNARSIKVEDINRVTGYNPTNQGDGTVYCAGEWNEYGNKVTYTASGSSTTNEKTYQLSISYEHPDGRKIGTDNVTSITVESTYFNYYPYSLTSSSDTTGECKGIATDSPAYKLLFKEVEYSLASTYVSAAASQSEFGIQVVLYGGRIGGCLLWNSNSYAYSSGSLGVRAVVPL